MNRHAVFGAHLQGLSADRVVAVDGHAANGVDRLARRRTLQRRHEQFVAAATDARAVPEDEAELPAEERS